MLGSNVNKCTKCDKKVYVYEEWKCLDKTWHKMCFKCIVCEKVLNMNNYKSFDKMPYCAQHFPPVNPRNSVVPPSVDPPILINSDVPPPVEPPILAYSDVPLPVDPPILKNGDVTPPVDPRILRKNDVLPVSAETKRILIYGTTGVGKSSLIKLITGIQDIKTDGGASGCTKNSDSYTFNFETVFTKSNIEMSTESEKIGDCVFYDTAGLNETEIGTVNASDAIKKLFNLVKSLRNGLNLLIYVRKKGAFSNRC